jgi:carbon-monoxide dehydrogenase medium subunit
MIPAAFEYEAPRELGRAIELLTRANGEAKILAGGQSLIPLMKFRLAQPAKLVDINRIDGLAYIREDGELRLGALTREVDLDRSDLIRTRYPIIAETAAVIADPLVRNLATVGGNIAHADPANDHPATLLALRASVVARGPRGERVVAIDDFFVDTFTTSLQPDEIVVEIRVPAPTRRSGGAYLKLERKVGDFAIAGVAAYLTLDAKGAVETAGVGLTNVGPTAIRARRAEGALRGRVPDEAAIAAAAETAASEAQPATDLRGPAEYKKDVVRVLAARALRRAAARAKGGD